MGIIDFILNLVALLLWLSWRSAHLDPVANSTPATLMGTLKKVEPPRFKGWQFLATLVLVLVLRALGYWQLGSPVDWTPKLNLGFVVLAFRSETFTPVALYSLLSFLRFQFIFYFWLLVLTSANRAATEPDPITRLLRLHLGRVARWPGAAQWLLPCLLGATLWVVLYAPLIHCGVLSRVNSWAHLAGQALLVGVALAFSLKWLLPAILLLYTVNSYVYLGSNPLWEFVSTTATNLLAPFHKLPLRIRRVDLTPLLLMVLIVALLHWLPNYAGYQMARRNLTMWPQ